MNQVREVTNLVRGEASAGIESHSAQSWHWKYRNSAYIHVRNIDQRLTEGDLIVVFSQFGEVVDLHISRDKHSGEPRGFAWIAFEDQRSTILAIENMNGAELLGRTLFVDHAEKYFFLHKAAGSSDAPVSKFAALSGKMPTKKENDNTENTENLLDLLFDSDSDYEERRRLVWDYEAYYSDTEEELEYQQLLIEFEAKFAKDEKMIQNASKGIDNTLQGRTNRILSTIQKADTDKSAQRFNEESEQEDEQAIKIRKFTQENRDLLNVYHDAVPNDEHSLKIMKKLQEDRKARRQAQNRAEPLPDEQDRERNRSYRR